MHRALRAIDQNRNAALMRNAADFLDGNNRSQRIRHMRDGDQLRLFRQRLFEGFDMEGPIVIDRNPDELRTLPLADEMPRHDIGVMLHDRQNDLVALADMRHPPAIGDRVDRFRRGLREDDLVHRTSIQEPAHLLARRLVSLRRRIRQEMQPAMDVGIFVTIGMRDRIDHGLRLLGRSAVVEIDERLAIDFTRQDREVPANGLDVVSCRVCVHVSYRAFRASLR